MQPKEATETFNNQMVTLPKYKQLLKYGLINTDGLQPILVFQGNLVTFTEFMLTQDPRYRFLHKYRGQAPTALQIIHSQTRIKARKWHYALFCYYQKITLSVFSHNKTMENGESSGKNHNIKMFLSTAITMAAASLCFF